MLVPSLTNEKWKSRQIVTCSSQCLFPPSRMSHWDGAAYCVLGMFDWPRCCIEYLGHFEVLKVAWLEFG